MGLRYGHDGFDMGTVRIVDHVQATVGSGHFLIECCVQSLRSTRKA